MSVPSPTFHHGLAAGPKFPWMLTLLGVGNFMAGIAFWFLLVVMVPGFLHVIDDFGAQLPEFQVQLIGLFELFSTIPVAAFFLAFLPCLLGGAWLFLGGSRDMLLITWAVSLIGLALLTILALMSFLWVWMSFVTSLR